MKPSCDVYIPETAPPVLPELGFGAELLGEQAASKWKSKTVKWTDENMEGQDLPIPLKIVVTLVILVSGDMGDIDNCGCDNSGCESDDSDSGGCDSRGCDGGWHCGERHSGDSDRCGCNSSVSDSGDNGSCGFANGDSGSETPLHGSILI